ncbi:DUF1015 family protein [Nocardioides sp. Leaf374]|uniref:DUF1015 family protein n=1 Tax=Nocardioides sp. Leaf374 TaxID=2876560 RepID=UPI001E634F91|nr:DUF1015 family protein [Nocardioides sp. Leaf374]
MERSGTVTPPYVAGPLHLGPFRALRMAPLRVGDPATARTFGRSQRKVLDRLARWEEHGQVARDRVPALYIHEYTAAGLTVRGVVGVLDLSRRAVLPAERAVLPHEGVRPAQADDLADKLAEIRLHPAPILLVHRASETLRSLTRSQVARRPTHAFRDRVGQEHRLWAVTDPDEIAAVQREVAPSRVLIADGHHRYAAYLRLQARDPGGAADHGLVMLVDQTDTPLHLGAIHRVVQGVSLPELTRAVTSIGGSGERVRRAAALDHLGPDHLVATDGEHWSALTLPTGSGRSAVELLHEAVLPSLPRSPRSVDYHHTAEKAAAAARPGKAVAVLLPAPDVDHVVAVAADDRLLPEKATSFQPKPSPGVLMHSLLDG